MSKRANPYLLHATIRPDAEVDHDSYPYNIAAVRDLANIAFHPSVTFFVGENGSGKSTVLEGIALTLQNLPIRSFGRRGGRVRGHRTLRRHPGFPEQLSEAPGATAGWRR